MKRETPGQSPDSPHTANPTAATLRLTTPDAINQSYSAEPTQIPDPQNP